ncbi:MAG: hypothetical protein IPM29_19475 [Planctomycetes bacterium]|nr:hypothetical protein [Planctomycetota bacterium]
MRRTARLPTPALCVLLAACSGSGGRSADGAAFAVHTPLRGLTDAATLTVRGAGLGAGVRVAGSPARSDDGGASWQVDVRLQPGDQELSVERVGADGTAREVMRLRYARAELPPGRVLAIDAADFGRVLIGVATAPADPLGGRDPFGPALEAFTLAPGSAAVRSGLLPQLARFGERPGVTWLAGSDPTRTAVLALAGSDPQGGPLGLAIRATVPARLGAVPPLPGAWLLGASDAAATWSGDEFAFATPVGIVRGQADAAAPTATIVPATAAFQPRALAFDPAGGRLFAADATPGVLWRAGLDGQGLTQLTGPHGGGTGPALPEVRALAWRAMRGELLCATADGLFAVDPDLGDRRLLVAGADVSDVASPPGGTFVVRDGRLFALPDDGMPEPVPATPGIARADFVAPRALGFDPATGTVLVADAAVVREIDPNAGSASAPLADVPPDAIAVGVDGPRRRVLALTERGGVAQLEARALPPGPTLAREVALPTAAELLAVRASDGRAFALGESPGGGRVVHEVDLAAEQVVRSVTFPALVGRLGALVAGRGDALWAVGGAAPGEPAGSIGLVRLALDSGAADDLGFPPAREHGIRALAYCAETAELLLATDSRLLATPTDRVAWRVVSQGRGEARGGGPAFGAVRSLVATTGGRAALVLDGVLRAIVHVDLASGQRLLIAR